MNAIVKDAAHKQEESLAVHSDRLVPQWSMFRDVNGQGVCRGAIIATTTSRNKVREAVGAPCPVVRYGLMRHHHAGWGNHRPHGAMFCLQWPSH